MLNFELNNTLKRTVLIVLAFSIVIQIILVLRFNGEQVSDFASYVDLAQKSVDNKSFYPSVSNIYTSYIHAPGYVNYLILILVVFGNVKAALFLNIILLLVLNWEIFYLAKKYFSEKVGWLSLLISCLYTTYYGIILYTGTELFFTTIAFGSICLYASDKLSLIAIAGILMGLANWTRPFLPVFLIAIILMTLMSNSRKGVKISVFLSSLAVTLITIGIITYKSCGYFIFQSSTSGVNLIMGANDHADGSYEETVFRKGNAGYLVNENTLTFKERDAFWRNAAIKWIQDNPGKYILLLPKKLFFMYAHDLHSLAPISGSMNHSIDTRDYIQKTITDFPKLTWLQWLMVFNQIFYVSMILLAVYSIILIIRVKNKMGIILGLIWILGTSMTILTVGGSCYHFPYTPVIIIFSAYAVASILFKKNPDHKNISLL